MDYVSIFVESNENLGLLFNSYLKQIESTIKFIDLLKESIDKLNDNPLEKIDYIKDKLNDYKKLMNFKPKPEPIEVSKLKVIDNQVKKAKSNLLKALNDLSKCKKALSFLKVFNFNNDKIFIKNIKNENDYQIINDNLRSLSFCIDYTEKYLLDLLNLTDQDNNILMILDVMYAKNHILERTNPMNRMQSFFNDLRDEFSDDYFYLESAEIDEDDYNGTNDPLDNKDKVSDPKKDIEEEKNGKNRKRLYYAFINYAKKQNDKNLFSSIYDPDAFQVEFSFIPESIRYFYRMANPVICIFDDLTFFSLNEIKEANKNNPQRLNYLVIASSDDYSVVISLKDEKIYKATLNKNDFKVLEVLDKSFDLWIQGLIGNTDFLNWE